MVDHAYVRAAVPEDAAAISALLYDFNGEALQPEALCRRMAEAQCLPGPDAQPISPRSTDACAGGDSIR